LPWPTLEVESWAQFAEMAAKITLRHPTAVSYLMRGQAVESWPLKPSLLRHFPPEVTPTQALAVEEYGLHEFRSQAHLHLTSEALPGNLPKAPPTEWWALMQHHNAPTRLLDWSLSPYVAAYFAVERDLAKPGAIFVVHTRPLDLLFRTEFTDGRLRDENLRDPKAPAVLMTWAPRKRSDRFVAQQGYFTFSVNILGVHDDLIEAVCGAARVKRPKTLLYEKWVIPPTLKLEFLRKLRAMNIAAHSLFPGIDGLGRSLAEIARLASAL